MDLMPPQDALFLIAEAREKPMHVGGLQLYRPPQDADPDFVSGLYEQAISVDEIRYALSRHPERVPPGIGPWRWVHDKDLDLEYHVRHSALPHPGRVRELLALVSRLHGTLLDRSRPLWEAHLIEGLADGRFAVYTKVHHALMDGVSAMKMLERSLDKDPDVTDSPPPWATPPADSKDEDGRAEGSGPSLATRVASNTITAARAVSEASQAAVRSITRSIMDHADTLPYQAPRSMLNVPISGARRFAADKWSFERVRAVSTALDATTNDVVMAICSGALRTYLADHDALPDDPLVAMVPVSLRSEADASSGNAVGAILCNLGTDVADPGERFEIIRRSMEQGKMRMRGVGPEAALLLSAMSVAPLGLGPLFRFELLRRPPFNVVISNVPGPQQTLYYHGAAMEGTYPISIPYDGQAVNITVSSYDGALGVGVTGCRRSVPHLQRLLDHLEVSLVELETVAGVA